jgi:hypothetical protein
MLSSDNQNEDDLKQSVSTPGSDTSLLSPALSLYSPYPATTPVDMTTMMDLNTPNNITTTATSIGGSTESPVLQQQQQRRRRQQQQQQSPVIAHSTTATDATTNSIAQPPEHQPTEEVCGTTHIALESNLYFVAAEQRFLLYNMINDRPTIIRKSTSNDRFHREQL